MLGFIHMGPVELTGARQKRQNKKWKILAHSGTGNLIPEICGWCSTDWADRTLLKALLFKLSLYIHVLQLPMYTMVYKFELERILSVL